MVVEIHLHTILQLVAETGQIRKINLTLPCGSTLAEVVYMLNLHFSVEGLLLVVNGVTADETTCLRDRDIVHIIPAISGG